MQKALWMGREREVGRQGFLRDKVWMAVIGGNQKGSVEGK